MTEERLHAWLDAGYGPRHREKGLDALFGLEQLPPLSVKIDEIEDYSDEEEIDESGSSQHSNISRHSNSSSRLSRRIVQSKTSRDILTLDLIDVQSVDDYADKDSEDLNISIRSSVAPQDRTMNSNESQSGDSIMSIMTNYYGKIKWADVRLPTWTANIDDR